MQYDHDQRVKDDDARVSNRVPMVHITLLTFDESLGLYSHIWAKSCAKARAMMLPGRLLTDSTRSLCSGITHTTHSAARASEQ